MVPSCKPKPQKAGIRKRREIASQNVPDRQNPVYKQQKKWVVFLTTSPGRLRVSSLESMRAEFLQIPVQKAGEIVLLNNQHSLQGLRPVGDSIGDRR